MANTGHEFPTRVYGDIEHLRRQLEELAAGSKPSAESAQDASSVSDGLVIRGK